MQASARCGKSRYPSALSPFLAFPCSLLPYFPIEGRELWQLDERPEAFLPDDLVGDGELVIAGLLSEDGRPRVEGSDALLLQGARTEVLEEQI